MIEFTPFQKRLAIGVFVLLGAIGTHFALGPDDSLTHSLKSLFSGEFLTGLLAGAGVGSQMFKRAGEGQ